MSVLTAYLNRMVLLRVTAAVIAISLFALVFDLLDASDDIIRTEGNVALAFGRYFALRLPSLVAEVLPFAALLGALFAAAELLRNSEFIVLWASGVSPLGIVRRLLPIGLAICALELANDELLVPPTIQELRAWEVGSFKSTLDGFVGNDIWMQHRGDFVRLPRLEPGATSASNVIILERDSVGNLVERLTAARAELLPGAWRLLDVQRATVGAGFTTEPELVWENEIDLDRLRVVARPPQEIGLLDLVDIIRNDGYGVVATQGHESALFHRLFGATLPTLLVMLTFALARRSTRQGAISTLFMKGIGGGFVFVILNGLALALAEAGFLPPLAATAGPMLLLLALVVGLPLRDELLLRRRAA
ncbi:MAG: LptF/LptG family permease [Geminicoccaceae bacterium]|nr:LptF/LptG family permease [Geminicoccaceae bacterium]HRY23531.1 LptF/LptG family permease [Geminicoccaceae bacterium]